MLHLFHGENLVASRLELQKWRDQYMGKEMTTVNGKSATLTEIIQATQSSSLFQVDKLVIIENFLTRKPVKKNSDLLELPNLFKYKAKSTRVIFWEEKEVPKSSVSIFPKTTDVALFRPNRSLFTLVDAILPGNTRKLIFLFEQTVKCESVELILSMLIRQIRLLIMAKDLGKNLPDLSPWQIGKIVRQEENFKYEELRKIYQELLNLEIRIKSGFAAFSLTNELKLFLIGI